MQKLTQDWKNSKNLSKTKAKPVNYKKKSFVFFPDQNQEIFKKQF